MPWEKSFDVTRAIDRAKDVFWQKGYASTSLIDLIEATGVNRGSLYNAFGNKRGLFVKALLRYDRENRRASLSQLEALDDPCATVTALFDGLMKEALEDTGKRGCLLVNTALELPSHDKEIRTIVTAALRDFEAFFQRIIEIGQARSEIPETIESQATASTLVGLVVGFRVLVRGAFDEHALRAIAGQANRLIT